ncbi:glycosyltransferase family 4 protein [Aliarcobacter butzleri]|uniref:glycosyltransferase family 4 protein n=1 Tax=Aliarcobacter butzleri TaxID=28197 RepID=UPI0021B27DCB|nr:glycosyltransferase family 4 protein [Aliarcobacter butzleri]MCT7653103.1 glycosyltransferase family 4 protein [Aliarcobacter butzleri]
MRNKIFISIYRFDEDYLTFINKNFKGSKNKFVSLFELKNKGIKNLIKEFITYKKYDEIIIVFNDENYFLVQDLFYTLSLSIFSLNITRILPDKRQEKVSLFNRINSAFKMIVSSIQTKKLVKKITNDIKLKSQKSIIEFDSNSKVFYLKTNLSFGTKAGGSLGHISGVVNSLAKKSDMTYISAETPIMINENIKKEKIYLNDIVYSVPYELNSIKINESFLKQVDELIVSNKPDVIYQRLTLFNYAGAYLSNKYKIPLIVEYNGSEVWVQNNWGTDGLKYSKLALDIEEYTLNSADTIITVSQVLQDELIDRGFDKEKIVFYPNCIDERVYDYKNFQEPEKATLREKLGFNQNDKIFTFIGTFGAWHGVEFLANSIVDLVQNHKQELDKYSVKFMLIGDGLLGEKVRSLLETENIKRYIKFTGLIPQKEAPVYLGISDCFLSPHIKQKGKFIGSPTKLFEYMAFSKPIIASNLDQIGEVFIYKLYANELDKFDSIKNESAIVYEPDNYDEFIKSILFVATKGNELEKMGKNAYEMAIEKYTWDVHVDKIINQFNR